MKSFKEILMEGKNKYWITVDVRDARKAILALNDNGNLKYKTDGTNFYIFKNEDDLLTAEDILKHANIKIADISE